ncbi:MAG: peptidoglycan DD-metalloendopeptidase family protein [Brevundimonas sp.]|uniref:murein hydrolase activator EnvC family protein n=1 Tax=Brevundimonas sp. TaxID=1871086 RepID=UPI00184B763A|nr:peptidoglycan DD-metalloendopeptidase family protein [Brevundimonas sp.]MBA4803463.1 peptidoglycan DD-metalloendopeptidase family protein [Brevundimonas sp.]
MRPLVLALIAVSTALPVAAAPQAAGDPARLQAEFRDERARARSLRAGAAEAAAEIAALERELASLRSAVDADDALIAAQRARLRELGVREAALVARLSEARGRQARLLSALQTLSRRPPPPLLIPADRAVDTVRASILMRAVAPELQTRAQALVDRQTELARIRRRAALNSEQLFTTESARGDRRAEIERLAARKTALQAVLRAEAQEAERAAAALERQLRALGADVPAPEPDAPSAATRLPGGRSRLTAPVSGAPSARFGRGSTGWRWRGDDLEARAPAAGRVAWTGPLSGWGQVVILDLGPGWRAVVAGLDEVAVETGARVTDGQKVGRTAGDGEVVFELRREERPIDPAPWLR